MIVFVGAGPGAEDLIAKLREIPGMTSISLNINREMY